MTFIVRVPGVNGGEKNKGCGQASRKILETLNEIHTNEQGVPINVRMFDLEEIHVDNSNLKLTHDLIYKNSLKIFEERPKTIFLGGDHFVSYSLTKAFLENCKFSGKEPCLIVLDSRPNCRNSNEEFPLNEGWLGRIVEEGFSPENIFLVGIRNQTQEEISFLKKNKVKVMKVNPIVEDIHDSCDIIMEFAKDKEVYISLDLGVVDPAFAPGVSLKEPGGLTSRQLLFFLQRISKLKNIRAIDLVNVNPDEDVGEITVKLAAKIVGEVI